MELALATARIVIGLAPLRTKARGRTNCVSFSVDLSHLVQSSIRGGVWAVHPVVFSVSYFCGIFHLVIAICLSVSTLSMFCLAAFHCPGASPLVLWGSYPLVGKGDLENYTFCHYCSKPKSPRTHHCRSCGMCVLDMDHHCPFIGNCVGAANHRYFILFLISAVVSTIYVAIMSVTAGLHIWSPLSIRSHAPANVVGTDLAMRFVKEIIFALLNSALLMSSRGLLLIVKKSSKIPRPLITVSPSDGRWHGNWNSEYVVSLKQLRLADLIEDDDHLHQHKNKDAQVSINLSIQKHASFGFSVDGRIITSFSRKCSYCSAPYCKKIDTTFNVWVLLSSRENRNVQLPDIGGDPSVIYVKPGYQADLDSLVQDTIRLTTAVKDTCSETCENSEPTVQYIGAKNTASMAKRWGRLLELRNTQLYGMH
ncbi:hypothetical protein CUMW_073710 [Citrus unshiu]|nr:hypothetical protein CUMW_073710 [Citrus unshiu]